MQRGPVASQLHDMNSFTRIVGLLAIVVLMAVDGINSTLLVVNRGQVTGHYAAAPDEASWLGIGYLAAKLLAFVWAPWIIGRLGSQRALLAGGFGLAICTGALAFAPNLEMAVLIRIAQGVCGAMALVAGQTLVFQSHAPARQAPLQAALALAVVVVPVMLAPALHGWITDRHDWRWVFVGSSLAALVATALLRLARRAAPLPHSLRSPGLAPSLLLASGIVGSVYVLHQGARFDWFDDGHIRLVTVASLGALAAALWSHGSSIRRFVQTSAANPDFLFGLCASVFAGFALFGSGAAIPLFGSVVLGLGPEHVGELALSSSIAAALGLVLVAGFLQSGRMPVAAPIPIGIALFMAGMWLFSLSSAQTGAPQVRLATWLRGLGMGFLFMSLTMITLSRVAAGLLAQGVALFNLGRQVGGLAGTAFVTTMLEWRAPGHATVLAQYLQPGSPALESAQALMAGLLVEHGQAATDAPAAAAALLSRQLGQQAGARAFDEIFLALALFFFAAIPALVGVKLVLSRVHARRVEQVQKPA